MQPAKRPIAGALSYVIAVVLILELSLVDRGRGRAWSWQATLVNAALLLLAFAISTMAHECAHAMAAFLIRLRPTALALGGGPALWSVTYREMRVTLHAVPFTGVTMVTAPTLRWLRLRLFVMYAAGPLCNLVLCALTFPFVQGQHPRSFISAPAPFLAMFAANTTLFFASVIPTPRRVRKGIPRPASDGWNVLTVMFRNEASLLPVLEAYEAWKITRLVALADFDGAKAFVASALKRDPDAPVARILETDILVHAGEWPRAERQLRSLLADPKVHAAAPKAIPVLQNNLAWCLFMQNDPATLEEADALSRAAITASPDAPAMRGTRGAMLCARGELDEAERLLMFAFEKNPPKSRALNACLLAMVLAKRGRAADARGWLEKACLLDARCELLARATAAVVLTTNAT